MQLEQPQPDLRQQIEAALDGKGCRLVRITSEYRGGEMVREPANFRAYDSYKQSFHDLVDFLQSNPRYQEALAATGNSERFVNKLQSAGYATDPQYARKISQIARKIDATYQTIARADGASTRTL